MATFESRLASRRFGRLQQIPPEAVPTAMPLTYSDFSGGFDLRDVRQDVPANTTPEAMDVDVSPEERIRRIHGIEAEETWSLASRPGLDIIQMIPHASLDYSTELLLFAPPLLGIKKEAETQWIEADLPSGEFYGHVNFGGTLLFSNRKEEKVFVRQPGESTIAVVKKAIPGLTYASFAARVFVGNAVIEGNTERMGIAWSATNSNYEDWEGAGSGFELLIDDLSVGDKILKLMPMGLDFMAIICRHSIWVASRTGLVDRPAAFQSRVGKLGAVSQAACTMTRVGPMFLHDSGIWFFDGNTPQHVSAQIDSALLPLDYENIESYRTAYSPKSERFYLMTPTETWVYELKTQRWWRMSLKALAAIFWSAQGHALTWDEAEGTWDEQTLTWDDMSPEQGEDYNLWFVARDKDGGLSLGKEKQDATCYFGIPQTPYYQFPLVQQEPATKLFTTQNVVLEYIRGGLVGLRQPNVDGDFVGTAVYELPASQRTRVAALPYVHTGLGAGLQLDLGEGCVEISRVQLALLVRGERIILEPLARLSYEGYDELSTLSLEVEVPETLQLVPGELDLVYYRGDTRPIAIRFSSGGNAINLTGKTITAQVRTAPDSKTAILSFEVTVVDAADGRITIKPSAADSAKLPASGYWDLQFVTGSTVETYLRGKITSPRDITRT